MFAATKLRKGHDFHKDKGGEIVKPWPMGGETHVSPPCLTQPPQLITTAG